MGEWINIKDKKPELNVEVLVYCEDNPFGPMELRSSGPCMALDTLRLREPNSAPCFLVEKFKVSIITHWMPLPELPK